MKRYYNSIIILAILIALSALILIIKPAPTGFVVYTGGQEYKYDNINKTWDFSDELSYNSSEIIINNSQASLKPIITIYNWTEEKHHNYNITYALYDPNNEITDLKTNDNNYLKPSDEKILNVFFENSLDNGNIINVFTKSSDPGNIYLCELNTLCSSPGYGSVSYDGGEGIYNITLSGLSSPTDSFSLVALEIKVNYVNSTNGNITRALYNPSDKMDKVSIKDNSNFEINNKIFDINFNNSIYNNDIVSFYLKSGQASEVYLCEVSTECSSPGYGKLAYNDEEGWYNITLSNLSSQKSSFSVNSDNKVKIDFIQAAKINITKYTSTNITYPTTSAIKTSSLDKIRNIKSIEFSKILNNQTMYFNYSFDEGLTWNSIPENVSTLTNSRIKLLITLNSDTLSAPALTGVSVIYDKVLPDTYHEINSSQLINISSFEPTIINNSNLLLNITTLEDITNANITIREFQNSSMEFKKPLRDLIDITVDNNTRDSLNSTSIKVYYTNEELSSGNLDESTLKFYYYNETSAEWQALSSTVNTANNFIEVSLSHLSIYGVFGDEIQSSPQQPSSGGGSSTRESQLSNDTKSKETTEVPDLIQEEIKSVTEIPVEQETPQKEDIQESLTGFSIFGIKISRIDLPSFIILVTGFILAISYSGYRLLKKRRAF